MRTTKLFPLCSIALVLGGLSVGASAQQKLYVYTSMKESMIGQLKIEFTKQHPDIKVDFQSAGAGKLMAKLAAERESGKILADILWTSEVPDFYQLRANDLLLKYIPTEAKALVNPLPEYDGSFTPARLGTLGIVYNTRFVKEAPKTWDDLKKPAFKGAFGIANPALSGTAFMSVETLAKKFGWNYFEALRANGAKMGKGSGQVVDDTASGDLLGCLGVDYITLDKIDKGATLGLVYPPEMLVIPSPVAIFKNTANPEAAKKFVDFVLSKAGQAIIAEDGTIPVRSDVNIPDRFKSILPPADEAMKRAMPIDYKKMMSEKDAAAKLEAEVKAGKKISMENLMSEKEMTIKKFTDIMQK